MIDDTIIIINGEECKRIYGFNRMYYVSKNGNVYNNHLKMLKPGYDGGRYRHVTFRIGDKPKTKKVHRLVAEAFLPNPFNYPQVNHIDGNKDHNNVDNLEWCSSKQNSYHRDHILGKNLIGVNNHEAILTEAEVKEIYYLHTFKKLSYVKLGNRYGVTSSAIRNIIKGKSWNHITGLKNTRKKSTHS